MRIELDMLAERKERRRTRLSATLTLLCLLGGAILGIRGEPFWVTPAVMHLVALFATVCLVIIWRGEKRAQAR